MNISTLAKILGVSVSDLRETGSKNGVYGFGGRNTRIPYNSALEITKILRPDKVSKLQNDDKIYLPGVLTVNEFAESIGKPAGVVVKTLVLNGVMVTLNEKIDYDTAQLIAEELGVEVFPESPELKGQPESLPDANQKAFDSNQNQGTLVSRPPVITVMGHVDHGKTTLLDTIRKTNVVATEAGAITQHISSYQIEYHGQPVTFVDTPGHEAFTAMRARGTQLADFIILMVSAVEGPKPQTVEVIERAKLSKTPVVVAINKIDLPNADVERAKTEVAAFGLVPEEWGGNTAFIPISAKTGENVDKLLETLMLMAQIADLKGQIDCPGQAVVIESHLDPKLGVEATVLITKDKLKVGDFIRCGVNVAKVRKLISSENKSLPEAEISMPVVLLGLPEVVPVGESVIVYKNQKEAQNAANLEISKRAQKRQTFQAQAAISNDSQINVVLVADVSGSLEALKESILKIPQENVRVVIKSESIGQVTEGDLEFAKIAGATILAFHTDLHPLVEKQIRDSKTSLVESDIIYELLQWVEEQILKHIKHEVKIQSLGKAEILAVFKSDKPQIQIIGAEVKEGKLISSKIIRAWRGEEELGKFEIVELQRNKVKTAEVNISQQFGISLTGKAKLQTGDYLECIDEIVIK
jgi:translation initiation factor IF-2